MGGKLLQSVWNLPEKRLSNDEYLSFKSAISDKLSKIFPKSVRIDSAPAIRSKESHGDLDIICGIDNFPNFNKLIEHEFGVKVHVNSNVMSFPVDGFQVDVTFVPIETFQSSIDYTSWGDASNLVGRIAHKFGLHHGHVGLSFWIRQGLFDKSLMFLDNDHVMEKLILTRDFSVILPLLGFDYDRWKQGFDTNEEVYHWVASSKYFSAEIFDYESLNHINRVRNKKRAMYAGFIEWLEKNSWKYNRHVFQRREYYLPMWAEQFPQLKPSLKHHKDEYEQNKKFKSKLNGELVMELLGISNGKEVGRVISEMKRMYSKQKYISMPQDVINNLILSLK
jgi:hypothetical protein